ncbi:MAG: glycosyltransferase family 2 protein [Cellvibrionaceae bacterium]|nr:glycosyltransferase family 2 protein [Cellvibrionaceae bacterium]
MNYCLVIPHYNHAEAFTQFFPQLQALPYHCIIVDDGSRAEEKQQLQALIKNHNTVHLLTHRHNRGKGAAVISGCYHASTLGFSHIVQIDADGQHDYRDIEKLIAYSEQQPQAIVSGKPYFDETAPKIRVYGRRLTTIWTAVETLSLQIKDGLCGFRVYPLKACEHLLDRHSIGVHMDFDTDILVKAVWEDIPLRFIPTKVIYPEKSVSHFNYWRDNRLLITLHSRLLCGMVLRSPRLLWRLLWRVLWRVLWRPLRKLLSKVTKRSIQ